MYQQIQCIGIGVQTLGELSFQPFGDREVGRDLRKRCDFLMGWIADAAASPEVVGSSRVLKLFMAPEYMFYNKAGAYPLEKIADIFDVMRPFTSAPRFADWMFVFGTAVAFLRTGEGEREVFNIALVQRGGSGEAGELRECIVYKEFVAQADCWVAHHGEGEDCRILRTEGARKHSIGSPRYDVRDRISEVNRSGIGGGGIFTMAGVTFGLEVCLDHNEGRLSRWETRPGDPIPQVRLLPASGLEGDLGVLIRGNMRRPVVWEPGTVVFLVDGVAEGAELRIGHHLEMTPVPPRYSGGLRHAPHDRFFREAFDSQYQVWAYPTLTLFEPVPLPRLQTLV